MVDRRSLVPSKEVSRIFFLRAQYVSPDEAISSHSFVLRRQTEFLALSQYLFSVITDASLRAAFVCR